MCAHATLLVQRMNKLPRGFTLIELLVVIAIIGVLSSIVLTSLNSARVKARDTQRVTEVREIAKALTAYFIDHGYFPTYSNTVTSAESDFLSVLVTEKYLPQIPRGPVNGSYGYHNYGPGNDKGAVIKTTLEGDAATVTGRVGSCRVFTNNWCAHDVANRDYCLCLTH